MTAATVLLYSDDPKVRERMRMAVGSQPAPDVSLTYLEASGHEEVRSMVEQGIDDGPRVDLVLLDGEAWPAGGLGIARQLRDEVSDCPLTCVVVARAADRWLAAYARADAVLTHPLDPVDTARTVVELLRGDADTPSTPAARPNGSPATTARTWAHPAPRG